MSLNKKRPLTYVSSLIYTICIKYYLNNLGANSFRQRLQVCHSW